MFVLTFHFSGRGLCPGGFIRVVLQDGRPWFVGLDVCEALGVKNVSQACGRVPEEHRQHVARNAMGATEGGPHTLIAEEGLSTLVSTRGEAGVALMKWVAGVVLPSVAEEAG